MLRPHPIPVENLHTSFQRIEFIKRLLSQGSTLVVDAEAYFQGSEGILSLDGEVYVYFGSPQEMLGKTFCDENAVLKTRLRRIYPPLDPAATALVEH